MVAVRMGPCGLGRGAGGERRFFSGPAAGAGCDCERTCEPPSLAGGEADCGPFGGDASLNGVAEAAARPLCGVGGDSDLALGGEMARPRAGGDVERPPRPPRDCIAALGGGERPRVGAAGGSVAAADFPRCWAVRPSPCALEGFAPPRPWPDRIFLSSPNSRAPPPSRSHSLKSASMSLFGTSSPSAGMALWNSLRVTSPSRLVSQLRKRSSTRAAFLRRAAAICSETGSAPSLSSRSIMPRGDVPIRRAPPAPLLAAAASFGGDRDLCAGGPGAGCLPFTCVGCLRAFGSSFVPSANQAVRSCAGGDGVLLAAAGRLLGGVLFAGGVLLWGGVLLGGAPLFAAPPLFLDAGGGGGCLSSSWRDSTALIAVSSSASACAS
jgi:hypothetical protein